MIASELAQRDELADFLRNRRARVMPSDVGLAGGGRRRTPGLRREEVALLANIGVTWYTRLEQGAPINVSVDVLRNIAKALQLTEREREHLFLLAGHRPDQPIVAATESVSPLFQRVLDQLDPNPASIRGRRYDILAWNQAALDLFGNYDAMDVKHRNLIWRFFMRSGECSTFFPRWEHSARGLVAKFRARAARYPDDPCFRELIDELLESSAEFRQYWSEHDVNHQSEGFKLLRHPQLGDMRLEFTVLAVPDHPDMEMVVYTAEPGSVDERKLRSLPDLRPKPSARLVSS